MYLWYSPPFRSVVGVRCPRSFQIPRTFELIEEGFTKENNMQTQKLSTKRHVVIKHYNDNLMHMYGDRLHQVQEEAA